MIEFYCELEEQIRKQFGGNFVAIDDVIAYISNIGSDIMKDKWINIRCTEQERQDITEQAKANNMSVAQFIRYLVAKERKEREKNEPTSHR